MKLKEKLEKSKKYQQFKEKKEAFNIIWSNPRYHGLIMLSFWFIVILIISFIVRTNNQTKNNTTIKTPEDNIIINHLYIKNKLNEINSYETIITLEKNDIIEIIEKTCIQNEQLIKYQNSIYYFKDNLYNIINNEMIIDYNQILMDTNYFNTFNIYNLIKDLNEEYITIYSDNSYIINYKIPIKTFLLSYNNTNIESNEYINLTIDGKETINKIKIDLTNLNIIDPNFYIKTITLELNNINKINKVNINITN